jgi:hypothetical protein
MNLFICLYLICNKPVHLLDDADDDDDNDDDDCCYVIHGHSCHIVVIGFH